MKVILFVNDSLFSYLLAKPLIERYHRNIVAVVFSNKITGSLKKVIYIYRKTHIRYFVYRSIIDIIGRIDRLSKRKTIQALSEEYQLRTCRTDNVNTDPKLTALFPVDIGVTLNFDQILRKSLLTTFNEGVFNVHASRLPCDKGISPVLWAFARGDTSVWSTIYRMDEGIDTGAIYDQIEIPVRPGDTAFSLYKRVCKESGKTLVNQLDAVIAGTAKPVGTSNGEQGSYVGWPDKQHAAMMWKNRKKFISFSEVLRR